LFFSLIMADAGHLLAQVISINSGMNYLLKIKNPVAVSRTRLKEVYLMRALRRRNCLLYFRRGPAWPSKGF
ncbi:MAG TPA: hypothetical protein PLM23_09700, partial [Syntrophorhabdaceae bacterium]|nr:hypothetical protein [Syntrophorhabdaceae bacterium]